MNDRLGPCVGACAVGKTGEGAHDSWITEDDTVALTLEQKNELYRWWNRLNNELGDLTSCRVQSGDDVDFTTLEASLLGCLRFIENRLAEDGVERRQQRLVRE